MEGRFRMPDRKITSAKKKKMARARRNRAKKKQKKQRRGPVMRFRFGQLILLWILSLIICFGTYLYNRNVHPELDVFVKPADGEQLADSSTDDTVIPEEGSQPEASADIPETPATADDPAMDGEDESSVPSGPTKINPVPESAPQPPEYLTRCAFLGETNIHNLGENGLLQPFNVYASETLTLSNYSREYVMLDGTTIRILSAINSASCPIYLMFGTESLSKQPADQTADQFSVLLNSVIATAPEAEVIVLSIPPVTADAEKGDEPILNSDIDTYNSMLLDLCNQINVYFVDVNTALKNNDGKLDRLYALEDGIHLTPEAGQIMLDYVLNHVPMT